MDRFDIGRAVKVPFEDASWVSKSLMALLWMMLVVTAPVVYGAQLEYIRRVAAGREDLPDWDDFGTKWVQGFLVGVAGFLYFLPVFVVGAFMIAPGVIAAINDGSSDAAAALLSGGMCIFGLLATVYTVAVSILFSAAMTHYAMSGSFGAFFQFGDIMAKVKGGTGYFGAWLWLIIISTVLSTASSLLSSVTMGIGAIVMPAVSYLAAMMMAHILGQWASIAYGSRGAAGQPPFIGAPPAPPAAMTPPAPPV